jgi:hypothetical protein
MLSEQTSSNTYSTMPNHFLLAAVAFLLVASTVAAAPLPSEESEAGVASRVELPADAADAGSADGVEPEFEGEEDLEMDDEEDENLDGGAAC